MGAILMFILIDIICVASLVYLFIEKRNEKKKMQAQHSSNVLNPLACGHRTASLAHHQRWHRNIDNGFNSHRATEFFKFSVSSENLKNTLRVSVPLCLNNKSTCPYVSVTCHMRFFSFFHSNPSKPSFFVSFSPSISRFNLRYTFAIPSLYLRFLLQREHWYLQVTSHLPL